MAITRSHGDQAAATLIGSGRWYAAAGQCAIAHGRLLIEKRQPTVSGMAAVPHTDKLQCVTITLTLPVCSSVCRQITQVRSA